LARVRRDPSIGEGRTKPLDSFARNSLMVMNGKQSVSTDAGPVSAIEWYAAMLAKRDVAEGYRIFRIDHPEVVSLVGGTGDRKRFSFEEMRAKFAEISRQADMAASTSAKKRDPFQRQIVDLQQRLVRFVNIAQLEAPYAAAPFAAGEEWRPLAAVLSTPSGESHPTVEGFRAILSAYSKGDPAAFNAGVRSYLALMKEKLPAETRRAGYEVVFNRFEPFYKSSVLYVGAFLFAAFGFLLNSLTKQAWAGVLSRAAVAVLIVALVVHTGGIASRIYLQGRPPVTNLYSSAVFIGWFCVILGLVIEWFYRLGLGSVMASIIGFATLVVAHNLSNTGDTMEMMQAVLDTNFWLATHVVVVTIGYSATFLAGFLAVAYILLGVFTPLMRSELGKSLPKTVYGVICFASLASFVGTVLGGIWADQSWGRFWGWDPKENGAALIVLMNLLILHARWGGMVRERGVAVLAVGGNIVTAWSWFGTNMLGVGLHSYGFMASAVFWLALFMLSQLLIMGIGLTPLRLVAEHASAATEGGRPSSGAADCHRRTCHVMRRC
jgi:ABC-type transport system involved in cytochrome c biogenesis permease subunit